MTLTLTRARECIERGFTKAQALGCGPIANRSDPPARRSPWRISGARSGAPFKVADCT